MIEDLIRYQLDRIYETGTYPDGAVKFILDLLNNQNLTLSNIKSAMVGDKQQRKTSLETAVQLLTDEITNLTK